MDTLADVLAATRLTQVQLVQLHARGQQWGCGTERLDVAAFHIVAQGTCWLRVAELAPVRLAAGDAVLLPGGDPHIIAGTADGPATSHAELIAAHPPGPDGVLRLEGQGAEVRILCGQFRVDHEARHPVLASLPSVVHRPDALADLALSRVVRLLIAEMAGSRLGGGSVAARLTDVLFIQMLRSWFDQADPQSAPGAATIVDPAISCGAGAAARSTRTALDCGEPGPRGGDVATVHVVLSAVFGIVFALAVPYLQTNGTVALAGMYSVNFLVLTPITRRFHRAVTAMLPQA